MAKRMTLVEMAKERDTAVRMVRGAERRAVQRYALIQGMGSAFSAALGFIDAGNIEGARAICSAGHMAFMMNLRERVSHEPGGINHEAGLSESKDGSTET